MEEKENYGKYPSILNVFKRDSKIGEILYGEWFCPEFEWLQHCQWDFYEKIDGMNIRIIFEDGKFSRRGRTDKAQVPKKLLQELDSLFGPYVNRYKSACFYGEGYGAGIQKGGNYQKEQKFILYDVKFGEYYAMQSSITDIATEMMLDTVPYVFSGSLQDGINVVAQGFVSLQAESICFAEGLVGRPRIPMYTRWGTRLQVKIKHRDLYKKLTEQPVPKVAVQIQKMNPDTGEWFDLFQCSEGIAKETLLFQRKMHPESQFRQLFTGHALSGFRTAAEAFPTHYE